MVPRQLTQCRGAGGRAVGSTARSDTSSSPPTPSPPATAAEGHRSEAAVGRSLKRSWPGERSKGRWHGQREGRTCPGQLPRHALGAKSDSWPPDSHLYETTARNPDKGTAELHTLNWKQEGTRIKKNDSWPAESQLQAYSLHHQVPDPLPFIMHIWRTFFYISLWS